MAQSINLLKLEKNDNIFEIEDYSKNTDTELLHSLMSTAQRFLEVNAFDTKNEPKFNEMDNDSFVKYIEKSSVNKKEILDKFEETNIERTLRSLMSNVYSLKNNSDYNIFIFFLPDDIGKSQSIGKDIIIKFISLMLLLNCKEGVMISEKELTSTSKKHIENCNIHPEDCTDIYNIITYTDDNFINIVDHMFTPEVMYIYRSLKEINRFADENDINISKLPRMVIDDPLVKFYRGKPGNIFKIKRKDINKKNILNYEIVYRRVMPTTK